jgi:putative CocE/NonD family hydrolase
MVGMRDGVLLATDVRLPDGERVPAPALVARTPYDKSRVGEVAGTFDIGRAVAAGYAVVVQDVRGRYGSGGLFQPHANETADGLDCLEWVAAQPWCDGVIGMFGPSYLGGTQWLPARAAPPVLKAIAPTVTFCDYYGGCAYQGGAKVLHDLRWVVADIIPGEVHRRAGQGADIKDFTPLDVETVLGEIPVGGDPLIGELAPFYAEWLAHPQPGPYWEAISPNAGHGQIAAAPLNIGGWYDIFLAGALDNYRGIRDRGATAAARSARLIVGPWTHMNFTGVFPELDFGQAASQEAIDLVGLQLSWFDRWLRDAPSDGHDDLPVLLFAMGVNEWRRAPDWPLPGTRYRDFYLHSGGAANTRSGDGRLSTRPPAEEPSDVFTSDPFCPVPSVGGQVILPGANAMGPRDQGTVEDRDDVLVYSTPPLAEPVNVTGPVRMRVFVSSSAPDTDLTGKLVDVFPDGRAMHLTDGILRLRYRDSLTHPAPMDPGGVYEVEVDIGATSNVFGTGHQIRLEIAGSNFPRFDRNSGTGGTIAAEPGMAWRTQVNQILHDAARPSRLILPVIESPQ